MVAIIVSAVVVCASALMLGQAVLRICGADRWSWLAAPTGLAVEMLVAIPAIHVPGRSATTAVVLGVLAAASAVWIVREPAMRPPLAGLVAAAPVAILTMVPFAAAGRGGILGVAFDNDMATHLLYAEDYRSAAAAAVVNLAPDYPIGPHALAGSLAEGLGLGVQSSFVGLTAAAAIVLAWTALAALDALDRIGRLGQMFIVTVAGMPFLVAAYYGQGSFKELMQASFVLGGVGALAGGVGRGRPLRWVPLALLTAGTLAVYNVDGLPWMAGLIGGNLIVGVIRRKASPRAALTALRREFAPSVIAVGVLAVVLVPQIPRLRSFISTDLSVNGTLVAVNNLGNLVGPLPFWEAFGTWDRADYLYPPVDPFATGMWTALVLGLAVFGVVWCVRRREWALPVAASVSTGIWIVSDRSQSPYVAAKALVILAPILLLLAARPLVDRDLSSGRWWRFAAPALAVVLTVKVVGASWQALRFSNVGPTDHLVELRSLRPLLDGEPTLFLGDDDFITWELAGVPVSAAVIGFQTLPSKPPKLWVPGDALDIDSVQTAAINANDWVITTRDAAASEMPPQIQLVRETRDYALWRRTGTVEPRDVLAEGDAGGAILNCSTATGRGIVRGGGDALIRPASSGMALPPFAAGASIHVNLPLAPGTYDLGLSYTSPQPINVQVVGHLKIVMDANLDRIGPRWPIGRVTIRAGQSPVADRHARTQDLADVGRRRGPGLRDRRDAGRRDGHRPDQ